MKTSLALWAAALAVALFTNVCHSAEPAKITPMTVMAETKSPPVVAKAQPNLLESISWGAVGAVRHVDITDHADYGAGLELGLPVNKHVSLRAVALTYDEGDWGGSAIDEVGAGIKATLAGSNKTRLTLYATGTGYRDFEHDDWGFGAGLGLSYKLNPHAKSFKVSLDIGTEIRAWFDQGEDLLNTVSLNIKL